MTEEKKELTPEALKWIHDQIYKPCTGFRTFTLDFFKDSPLYIKDVKK